MPIRFKNLPSGLGKPQKEESFSAEAVELMQAISLHEAGTGKSVTRPHEVFSLLLEMGFRREDRYDKETRSEEFLRAVRGFLKVQNRRSPSYNEVLKIMRRLGYHREKPVAIG